MPHRLLFFGMLNGANRFVEKSAVIVGVLLTLGSAARSQDWRFTFDSAGNMSAETPANLAPPQILTQPQPQVVGPGELTSFFVLVADARAITYQWRFSGTNLPGAVSDTLLLTNVSVLNEGQYSVALSNSSGSVTSAPAALLLDGDGDGLPDSWELTYFPNLNQTATGDFDGDGASNLDEFRDGTNPADNASAVWRLTASSDGGLVSIVPTRLGYTNGEIVTLTATALPGEIFHGWTGDITTRSNPVTLTMTNNKAVFAYFKAVEITWTNVSGDWNVASNWKPNVVPTGMDDVFITKNAIVTLNSAGECRSLTLGSSSSTPTLAGSGTLTLFGTSFWTAGFMSGSGRTIVQAGATLKLNNLGILTLSTRTLENGGTILWTGAQISLTSAVITNRTGALFETLNAAALSFQSGFSRFDNAGTFRKSSPGTTSTASAIGFNNYGAVELQSGTLFLGGGGVNNGTMEVLVGTTLDLAGGTFTASAASSITGAGNLTVSGVIANLAGLVNMSGNHTFTSGTANLTGNFICTNNAVAISSGTANFSGTGPMTPAVLNLSGGTLNGSQDVTVLGQMNWAGGTMSGSGRTIIAAGGTLNLNNAANLALQRRLENGGSAHWTGANIFLTSAVITNRAGALFEALNAAALSIQSGVGRFDNAGTFRKSVSTEATTVGNNVAFNNYGTVDIRSGSVVANGGYTSTSGALLSCALGGTTPGTGFGQLQVFGSVTLNGALKVDLLPGFSPATNDSFTVLTAGTRNSAFASFAYPSNRVTMQLSNTLTSVILRVTEVFPVPQPVLLTPELSGPDLRLTWSATSNITYRLEFNPDLTPSNWNALPGDITTASNTASKLDPLTTSNRLYRVRVLP